jgi:YidC/Oxa1 family membrane protein insertase
MGHFFFLILIQPILNLLVLMYRFIPDIGIVIILLTVVIRLLLMPSFHKSLKAQKQMSALQPMLNEVREKHKNDKEKQAKAIMELYKEQNVSPFGSLLPLLIQLPLLIALYKVFILGLGGKDLQQYLYSFVHNPGFISPYFLHFVNLAKPNIYLGIVSGAAQFIQSKMMIPPPSKSNDATANALAVQTVYILPLLTVFISLRLPAGLPLYWLVTTLFAVGQQYYIMKTNKVTA